LSKELKILEFIVFIAIFGAVYNFYQTGPLKFTVEKALTKIDGVTIIQNDYEPKNRHLGGKIHGNLKPEALTNFLKKSKDFLLLFEDEIFDEKIAEFAEILGKKELNFDFYYKIKANKFGGFDPQNFENLQGKLYFTDHKIKSFFSELGADSAILRLNLSRQKSDLNATFALADFNASKFANKKMRLKLEFSDDFTAFRNFNFSFDALKFSTQKRKFGLSKLDFHPQNPTLIKFSEIKHIGSVLEFIAQSAKIGDLNITDEKNATIAMSGISIFPLDIPAGEDEKGVNLGLEIEKIVANHSDKVYQAKGNFSALLENSLFKDKKWTFQRITSLTKELNAGLILQNAGHERAIAKSKFFYKIPKDFGKTPAKIAVINQKSQKSFHLITKKGWENIAEMSIDEAKFRQILGAAPVDYFYESPIFGYFVNAPLYDENSSARELLVEAKSYFTDYLSRLPDLNITEIRDYEFDGILRLPKGKNVHFSYDYDLIFDENDDFKAVGKLKINSWLGEMLKENFGSQDLIDLNITKAGNNLNFAFASNFSDKNASKILLIRNTNFVINNMQNFKLNIGKIDIQKAEGDFFKIDNSNFELKRGKVPKFEAVIGSLHAKKSETKKELFITGAKSDLNLVDSLNRFDGNSEISGFIYKESNATNLNIKKFESKFGVNAFDNNASTNNFRIKSDKTEFLDYLNKAEIKLKFSAIFSVLKENLVEILEFNPEFEPNFAPKNEQESESNTTKTNATAPKRQNTTINW